MHTHPCTTGQVDDDAGDILFATSPPRWYFIKQVAENVALLAHRVHLARDNYILWSQLLHLAPRGCCQARIGVGLTAWVDTVHSHVESAELRSQ